MFSFILNQSLNRSAGFLTLQALLMMHCPLKLKQCLNFSAETLNLCPAQRRGTFQSSSCRLWLACYLVVMRKTDTLKCLMGAPKFCLLAVLIYYVILNYYCTGWIWNISLISWWWENIYITQVASQITGGINRWEFLDYITLSTGKSQCLYTWTDAVDLQYIFVRWYGLLFVFCGVCFVLFF